MRNEHFDRMSDFKDGAKPNDRQDTIPTACRVSQGGICESRIGRHAQQRENGEAGFMGINILELRATTAPVRQAHHSNEQKQRCDD